MLNLSGTPSFNGEPGRKRRGWAWVVAAILIVLAVFGFLGRQVPVTSKQQGTTTTSKKSDAPPQSAAELALAAAPDVQLVVPEGGGVMVMMPYGPCGTLSRIGQEYVWNGAAGPVDGNIFDTKEEAIIAAANECESTYLRIKKHRELSSRMATSPH
jgi:hypothetical protein